MCVCILSAYGLARTDTHTFTYSSWRNSHIHTYIHTYMVYDMIAGGKNVGMGWHMSVMGMLGSESAHTFMHTYIHTYMLYDCRWEEYGYGRAHVWYGHAWV
jgi:hypothetical protein